MLMQILGWQTESIMACYSIFWSGQLALTEAINSYLRRTRIPAVGLSQLFKAIVK